MERVGKKQIIVSNFFLLLATVVLGVGMFGFSNVHGAIASVASVTVKPIRKADLVISNFTIVQGQCYNYGTNLRLSGHRNISFQYDITNVGNKVSPYYFVKITNSQNGAIFGGGGDSTVLQPGELRSRTYGGIKPSGRYKFNIVVYPMAVGYIPWSSNYVNFINWSLDANAENNYGGQGVHIDPCPQ